MCVSVYVYVYSDFILAYMSSFEWFDGKFEGYLVSLLDWSSYSRIFYLTCGGNLCVGDCAKSFMLGSFAWCNVDEEFDVCM